MVVFFLYFFYKNSHTHRQQKTISSSEGERTYHGITELLRFLRLLLVLGVLGEQLVDALLGLGDDVRKVLVDRLCDVLGGAIDAGEVRLRRLVQVLVPLGRLLALERARDEAGFLHTRKCNVSD